MIVFTLTMQNVGSWNGKWSQEGTLFCRVRKEREVPKELWGKEFYHHWDDGWTACISVDKVPANEARKLERQSKGFNGYDWMIRTLIRDGYIHYENRSV